MHYLFIIMTMLDGNVINYRYSEPTSYFECMQNAEYQATKMSGEGMKSVEMYCGRNSDFVRDRLLIQ